MARRMPLLVEQASVLLQLQLDLAADNAFEILVDALRTSGLDVAAREVRTKALRSVRTGPSIT